VRAKVWSYAMDQRAFGPRKLMVAFTDADGQLRVLAHAKRTKQPLLTLEACLDMHGDGAAAAVVWCDERVPAGPPPPEFHRRFEHARELAASYGVHLVDWIACDDEQFRAARLMTLMVDEQPDWWDVPAAGDKTGTRRRPRHPKVTRYLPPRC